jgi:acyl carrier protein
MESNATSVRINITQEQWLRLVERMLEMDPGKLRADDSLASIQQWDSLAVVQYLALIDRQFGVTVIYEQIASCGTFDDLFEATAA